MSSHAGPEAVNFPATTSRLNHGRRAAAPRRGTTRRTARRKHGGRGMPQRGAVGGGSSRDTVAAARGPSGDTPESMSPKAAGTNYAVPRQAADTTPSPRASVVPQSRPPPNKRTRTQAPRSHACRQRSCLGAATRGTRARRKSVGDRGRRMRSAVRPPRQPSRIPSHGDPPTQKEVVDVPAPRDRMPRRRRVALWRAKG